MDEHRIGLLGATSLVGECLLPILAQAGWHTIAFSRRAVDRAAHGVEWRSVAGERAGATEKIPYWICAAPIWILPDYFDRLEAHDVRNVVAISSTSRFTKDDSSSPAEQAVARRLADAEEQVRAWAESKGINWTILRPTLIYGRGRDKNISEIARVIRRLRFFPLFGQASGLRQPIHSEDVAAVTLAALNASGTANRAYNISGGETLSYRTMVNRVFAAYGQRPLLLTVPLGFFRIAAACLQVLPLPRYRQWSPAMAERMNRDLVFDRSDAEQMLGFRPRAFRLTAEDLPS